MSSWGQEHTCFEGEGESSNYFLPNGAIRKGREQDGEACSLQEGTVENV